MLEKLSSIQKSYLLGVCHVVLTVGTIIALYFLSAITGLGLLIALMDMVEPFLVGVVIIAGAIVSLLMRNPLKKSEHPGRILFAATVLPLFVSIWVMYGYYFGFGDVSFTRLMALALPVVSYFFVTYLFLKLYKRK